MRSTKEKPLPRRQLFKKESSKSSKTTLNFDAQDDVYVVNATDLGSELLAVRYCRDSKILVVGGALGSLLTVQPSTHEILGTFENPTRDTLDNPITCIREYPSSYGANYMLAISASGHIQCWDVNSGELKFNVKELRQCLGLAVSSDNFITTGDDGVLYVYDIPTTNLITTLEPSPDGDKVDGHSTRTFAVAFNPNNTNEAISGGWDDCVHFWDVRQKHSLRRIGPAHICGSDALDFQSDGKEILTGSYQKTDQIQMWEYATGALLRTIETDRFPSSTIGLVKDMDGCVTSIHKAAVRLKIPAKPKLNKGRERPNGKSGIPRVAFAAGQYLFEVEFY